MTAYNSVSDEAGRLRTVTIDDATTVVADFGASFEGTAAIRGDTVVVDSNSGRHEVAVETTPERAYLNNGVLTIEYGEQR